MLSLSITLNYYIIFYNSIRIIDIIQRILDIFYATTIYVYDLMQKVTVLSLSITLNYYIILYNSIGIIDIIRRILDIFYATTIYV